MSVGGEEQVSLAKLSYDNVKDNDIKLFFEVLMVPSENRTISDLDSLVKIMMHIEPIKRMKNLSAVYFACKSMALSKFKCKQILYEQHEQPESLYIVLNGKIAFLKKSSEYFQSDQIIFLNNGACFGSLYEWKTSFMPISVQESILAVLPHKQNIKIPIYLNMEKQRIFEEIKTTDIFDLKSENVQEAMSLLTFNKVPCGQYLIRQGETPKALFFLSRGIIKKIFQVNGQQVMTKRFSQGEYFPSNLKKPITYDLMAETSCEVITIPKKALRMTNSEILLKTKEHETVGFVREELRKKEEWVNYKNALMENLLKMIEKEKGKMV